MFSNDHPLILEYLDGEQWKLVVPFAYLHAQSKTYIRVPEGFETDFASVPRFFWRILPPTGDYGKAAVIHDWLYWRGRAEGRKITREFADQVFRDAMADLGVGRVRRNIMYAAVRVGAAGVWSRYRKERS